MICGLEFAVGAVLGIGLVVESAVGQRTAKTLVEEQEQQRHLQAFSGEAVGITRAIALKQPVPFQLAQIIAELVQAVAVGGELKRGEDGLVNLFGSPAADSVAAMQEDLQ